MTALGLSSLPSWSISWRISQSGTEQTRSSAPRENLVMDGQRPLPTVPSAAAKGRPEAISTRNAVKTTRSFAFLIRALVSKTIGSWVWPYLGGVAHKRRLGLNALPHAGLSSSRGASFLMPSSISLIPPIELRIPVAS